VPHPPDPLPRAEAAGKGAFFLMEGVFAGGFAAREHPLLFWIPRPRAAGAGSGVGV